MADNDFAKDYYEDETDFAKKYNNYFGDYAEAFGIKIIDNNLDQDSVYRVENSQTNYDLIKPIIDQRFKEWEKYRKK